MLLKSEIDKYCKNHSTKQSLLLASLYRETYQKTVQPWMISSPTQGRVLSFFSKIVEPRIIVEVGTFTGYSTLCLSEGLSTDGKIITIEVNPDYQFISEKYFKTSAYEKKIIQKIGDAQKIIPSLDFAIDLVYMDANKKQYSLYYEYLIEKVNSGGIIIVDNVLWGGKVLEPLQDSQTKSIHEFNKLVKSDSRVSNVMLNIEDGINIIIKK